MTISGANYLENQTLDEAIGERVHLWLRRKSFMQRDLADTLNLTPAAVSHKIAGRSAWSALDLVKTAAFLDLPISELMSDDMVVIEQKKMTPELVGSGAGVSHLRESNSRPSHYRLNALVMTVTHLVRYIFLASHAGHSGTTGIDGNSGIACTPPLLRFQSQQFHQSRSAHHGLRCRSELRNDSTSDFNEQ